MFGQVLYMLTLGLVRISSTLGSLRELPSSHVWISALITALHPFSPPLLLFPVFHFPQKGNLVMWACGSFL